MNAFPQCKFAGPSVSSIGYFSPCRLQCEQIKAACGSPSTIPSCGTACGLNHYPTSDCSRFPSNHCMLYVPPGYFVVDPESGPFKPLLSIYAVIMVTWYFLAWLWNYLTFVKYLHTCVTFCRAVSGIPILKAIVVSFGMAFWATCDKWKMCSFWMGVSLVNTQLVYETGTS